MGNAMSDLDDKDFAIKQPYLQRIAQLEQQLLERDALIEKLKNIFELSFGITKRESEAINLLYAKLSPSEALAAHYKALLDEAFGEPVGFVRDYGVNYLTGCQVSIVTGTIFPPSPTMINPHALEIGDIPLYRRKEIVK
jgi:hypothetical protein